VIAAAKAAPGKVTVATSGGGTQQHLGLEQMKLMAGVDITSVPYRGAGAALNDLLANQIQIGILNMSSMLGPIRDGRLRGIAVTSGERSQHAPDIPSVSETVAGFDSIEWFAFVAPGTISDDIVARLHAAIVKAAQKPEFQARAKEMGVDLVLNTPSEFATVIAADMARVEDLVKKVDIKVD
jgi:tripartite-type tricarboxylate transporter receptor subunit TctC